MELLRITLLNTQRMIYSPWLVARNDAHFVSITYIILVKCHCIAKGLAFMHQQGIVHGNVTRVGKHLFYDKEKSTDFDHYSETF